MWGLTLGGGGGVGGVAECPFHHAAAVLSGPLARGTDVDAPGPGLLLALLRVLDGHLVVVVRSVRPLVDQVTRLHEREQDVGRANKRSTKWWSALLLKPGLEVGVFVHSCVSIQYVEMLTSIQYIS